MKPRFTSRLRLAAVAALLLPAAAVASPAFAHDALSSTTPAVDAVVATAPETVSLTLTEPPTNSASLNLSVITVTDGAGKTVSDGTVRVDGPTLSTTTVPGSPGTYKVLWRAVSSDGHPIEGNYSFTVQASTAASEPAAGASPSAEAGASSAAPQSTDTAVVPDTRPNNDNAPLALGVAFGLLAAALGVTWWLRRRTARQSS